MFPAFMGLAFPVFLGLQLVVTLYWVIRLRWQMLLGLAVVYALSWGSLSAYFPINRSANQSQLARLKAEAEQKGQSVLKVLSYNVALFGYNGHSSSKPNRILLYLKSSEADIVCLQEASLITLSEGQVRSYLGQSYPYIRYVPSQATGSVLMVLSRYPITEARRLEIDSYTNGAALFTLDIRGKRTTVINVHLESFRLNNRIGKRYLEMASRGNFFTLEDALNSKFSRAFTSHEQQAKVVSEAIAGLGSERVIVAGDFNDTPVSYALCRIGSGLKNVYTEAGNGLGLSFRSRLFKVRIDHILVGGAFRPVLSEVDRSARGSDHYPIWSYLIDEDSTE